MNFDHKQRTSSFRCQGDMLAPDPLKVLPVVLEGLLEYHLIPGRSIDHFSVRGEIEDKTLHEYHQLNLLSLSLSLDIAMLNSKNPQEAFTERKRKYPWHLYTVKHPTRDTHIS